MPVKRACRPRQCGPTCLLHFHQVASSRMQPQSGVCHMTTAHDRRNTMTPLNPRYTDMQRAIRHALGAHWRLFLFQGAIMIILGALAFAAPAAATIAVDIYLGRLFLI